jgi:S1-C subfamily serine protease
VRIDRIASNGPAEQVGLQIGDYILALGGVYLFTVEELTNNIHRYKPGAQVSLRYRSRSTIYDTFVVMGHVTLTAGTAGKAAN